MSTIDQLNMLTRIAKTLDKIVQFWPECTRDQLLEAARQLPSVIDELPLQHVTTDRAVGLYMEALVDSGALPPWCG